ncbi:RagB/SusD family nutrient uptake outer membrane protein [Mucilaginibacter sp.]|uniref:RagB/SusD family nutrient uptake outer membrane protein n=1 Tax=Mucilaginibacter sp. TaxID=1882438 RepID=UPI0025D91EC6|nr:RagB/SusD family nutrient uptake outer membrane protein [Mucilaginibacter sp.]
MKKFQLKLIIPLCLLLICTVYACKKSFLDKPALGQIDPALLSNKAGVESLLIGAYSELDGYGGNGAGQSAAPSNWMFGSITGGDAYKGSDPSDGANDQTPVATFILPATNSFIIGKYAAQYDGVQRANDVLRGIPNAKDLSADDIKRITGEAKFLRGYFYFELRRNFFMVPYADETATDFANIKNDKDIYPLIEADFKFAAENLPETQPQRGRANKYAAMAYLAKVYMAQAKYTDAKPLLATLMGASAVTAGGQHYALNDHFQQNFSPEAGQKNSAESVFAVQASVNDGSLGNNSNQGDNLNFPYNGGPGGCCGFFNPSQWLANSYKTDPVTGLPLLDNFNAAPVVTDVTYTGTLDPRIDITMGRKGIPYLDWGPHPGDAWIRNPGSDGHFSPKKNVYSKSEVGTNTSTENTWTSALSTSNNVNLIRYSDVILWAAECEVEIGSLTAAMADVNMVRERAQKTSGWVYLNSPYDASKSIYTVQTTPAANYKIGLYTSFPDQTYARKAVRFERKIELAMEGHRFFDLQRWGSAYQAAEINAFFASDKSIDITLKDAHFTQNKSEYRPIPQAQIDISNSKGPIVLKQNPGY